MQPSKDALPYSELPEVDRYTLSKLAQVMDDVRESYDKYQFYRFYQLVQRFMVVDLSNFYFDICKYVHVCYNCMCLAFTGCFWMVQTNVEYSPPPRAAICDRRSTPKSASVYEFGSCSDNRARADFPGVLLSWYLLTTTVLHESTVDRYPEGFSCSAVSNRSLLFSSLLWISFQ
jgi:hypothetical protein